MLHMDFLVNQRQTDLSSVLFIKRKTKTLTKLFLIPHVASYFCSISELVPHQKLVVTGRDGH